MEVEEIVRKYSNMLYKICIVILCNEQDVQDAIQERLDTQLKSFEGYGAEQTALLNKHVFLEKGNFVLYVVGEHASDAQKVFVKSL